MNQSKQRKRRRQLATGMLLTLMLCVSGVLSASPLQVQRMSVKLENGTLRELFHLIEEKFDYSFLVRQKVLSAVLLGLPAAGAVVIRALPAARREIGRASCRERV